MFPNGNLGAGMFPPGNLPVRLGWPSAAESEGSPIGMANEPPLPQEATMLWTIALILLVLWALGLVSSFTMGGFIHILLVAAVVIVLVRVIQGRRVV
jgi:hypothetical protein